MQVYAAAIGGLQMAGKGDWLTPYLPALSALLSEDFVRAIARYDLEEFNGLGDEIDDIGLGLYAIGERDLARRLYETVLPLYQRRMEEAGISACGQLRDCEYFAFMTDTFDGGKDSAEYYDPIPGDFTVNNSGINIDAKEAAGLTDLARWEGFLHERAGRYRLAELYYQTAESGFEWISRKQDPLASQKDLQLAASFAHIRYRQGLSEEAHALTKKVVASAREKLGGGTAYSSRLASAVV